jgi:hypothetical protein
MPKEYPRGTAAAKCPGELTRSKEFFPIPRTGTRKRQLPEFIGASCGVKTAGEYPGPAPPQATASHRARELGEPALAAGPSNPAKWAEAGTLTELFQGRAARPQPREAQVVNCQPTVLAD